jgi:uncharacterized protein (DUF433 family)
MSLLELELPESLEVEDDGSIRVKGHRVWLYHILSAIYSGSPEWNVLEAFPTIPAKTLSDILVFCIRNPEAVRETYERQNAAVEKLRTERAAGGPVPGELRDRMKAKFGGDWTD